MRIFRKTALLLLLSSPLALLYIGQEDLLTKLDNIPFRFQQVIKPTLPGFSFLQSTTDSQWSKSSCLARPSSSSESPKDLKLRRLDQLGSVMMQQLITPYFSASPCLRKHLNTLSTAFLTATYPKELIPGQGKLHPHQ